MADQFDIFGETQALEPEPAGYLARDASAPQGSQPRLFEPQMEGQLTLETQTPATQDRRRDATTTAQNRGERDG